MGSAKCAHTTLSDVGERLSLLACLGTAVRRWCLLKTQASTLFASAFPGRILFPTQVMAFLHCVPLIYPWFPASTYSCVSSKPASHLLPSAHCIPLAHGPSYLLGSRSWGKASVLPLGPMRTLQQPRKKSVLSSPRYCVSCSK